MKQKLFTLIIALFAIVGTASAAIYNLSVGGVQVTDENKADILGDGTVAYNSGTKKLTLNNANITKRIDASIKGIEIILKGENRIQPSESGERIYGIYSDSDLTISGDGSLSIDADGDEDKYPKAIGVNYGILTINSGDITVSSHHCYTISSHDIVINGGTITASADGGYWAVFFAVKTMTIKGGTVTAKGADSCMGILASSLNVEGGTVEATTSYKAITYKTELNVYSTAALREGDAAPGKVVSTLTWPVTYPYYYSKKYVKIAPTSLIITKQPKDVTIKKGKTTTLSVEAADGKTPYTYQWQCYDSKYYWINISGETSSTFKTSTTLGETTKYRCLITDAAGNTLTSNEVTVTVKSDVTAPTVSDRTITVKEVTSSKIWVTWNTAKDDVTAPISMRYKVFCVDEAATVLGIFLVFATEGKVEELPVSYESTGARSATVTKYIDKDLKLQNLEPGKEYIVFIYALDKAGNYADYDPVTVQALATGIENVNTDEKTVSDVKYFAPDGRAVTATAKGIIIRKTIYTDGTVKTDKVKK